MLMDIWTNFAVRLFGSPTPDTVSSAAPFLIPAFNLCLLCCFVGTQRYLFVFWQIK